LKCVTRNYKVLKRESTNLYSGRGVIVKIYILLMV